MATVSLRPLHLQQQDGVVLDHDLLRAPELLGDLRDRHPALKVMISLMSYTGMRADEVVCLHVKDLQDRSVTNTQEGVQGMLGPDRPGVPKRDQSILDMEGIPRGPPSVPSEPRPPL